MVVLIPLPYDWAAVISISTFNKQLSTSLSMPAVSSASNGIWRLSTSNAPSVFELLSNFISWDIFSLLKASVNPWCMSKPYSMPGNSLNNFLKTDHFSTYCGCLGVHASWWSVVMILRKYMSFDIDLFSCFVVAVFVALSSVTHFVLCRISFLWEVFFHEICHRGCTSVLQGVDFFIPSRLEATIGTFALSSQVKRRLLFAKFHRELFQHFIRGVGYPNGLKNSTWRLLVCVPTYVGHLKWKSREGALCSKGDL